MEQRSHCESIELQKYPYHFQSKYRTKEVSKRIIISGTAKLFDPLGWIAEVIVNAKFMVQELWQRKSSRKNRETMEIISNQIPCIGDIKIPRWIYQSNNFTNQLHVFSNGSEKTVKVIYIKTAEKNKISLILAK